MTEIQQKPAAFGLIGTLLVWTLIFLFFYFASSLFAPKEFKTIKIRLDSPQSTQQPQKSQSAPAAIDRESIQKEAAVPSSPVQPAAREEAPAPVKESAPVKKSAPAQEKKIDREPAKSKAKPKKASNTEAASAKSKSQPTKQSPSSKNIEPPKMVEQQLQKSIDELMAEQRQKKTVKKEFDWSSLEDVEGNSSSNTSASQLAKNTSPSTENVFSGSAASNAASSNTSATASSSTQKNYSQGASSETAKALQGIASAKNYVSSGNGISSNVNAKTGSSDGKTALAMSDGSLRALLEPSEPKITLSPAAAALIDSRKDLTVTFTVSRSGSVSILSVKISPDILPSLVKQEISQQISRWRFASSSSEGIARFDYTIKKQ